MNWLKKEVCGADIFYWIVGCIIINFCNGLVMVFAMNALRIHIPAEDSKGIPIFVSSLPWTLLHASLKEELMFRLPLFIAVEGAFPLTGTLAFAATLSAAFGFLHGGVEHIFIQGLAGFLYCILFLKCGGLQRRYIKAYLVVVATHTLFNSTLAGFAAAAGGSTF